MRDTEVLVGAGRFEGLFVCFARRNVTVVGVTRGIGVPGGLFAIEATRSEIVGSVRDFIFLQAGNPAACGGEECDT